MSLKILNLISRGYVPIHDRGYTFCFFVNFKTFLSTDLYKNDVRINRVIRAKKVHWLYQEINPRDDRLRGITEKFVSSVNKLFEQTYQRYLKGEML